MPVGNNSAILAAEIEKVQGTDLEELYALDSVLWKEIKALPKDTVSTRPERVVFDVYPGGKARANTLDGDDLGRGGAPQFAYGNVAPYAFTTAFEWTELAMIASNNREKAVVDYMQKVLKTQSELGAFVLDGLVSYGDGTNTLGTVTSYDNVNYIIYVDNAARFYAGQDVDVYSALGTKVGTVTILGTDNTVKALYLGSAPGFSIATNNLLLLSNSAGTANTGMNGILAYQSSATTGTYIGASRTSYPGAFTTPNVNAGAATLTPQLARLLLAQLKLARGVNSAPGASVKFHMGLDQRTAWENTGINVTQVIQSGDKSTGRDMLAKEQVDTIGGIEIISNLKAIPGRIDLLDFETWYRTEVQPLDFYEVDGRRIFQVYGGSGGVATSQLSYMVWMGNVVCKNPRRNAFISNLAVPSGY